ncbi:hypothetical protein V2G26_000530 [Clonostachys chloroleuca]
MRQPELGAATTPLGLDTNVPGPGETVKILFRSSEYLSLICMHEEEGTVEGGGAGTSVASTHNADGELALVELDEGKPSKMLAAGLASAKVGEPTALLHTPLLAPLLPRLSSPLDLFFGLIHIRVTPPARGDVEAAAGKLARGTVQGSAR